MGGTTSCPYSSPHPTRHHECYSNTEHTHTGTDAIGTRHVGTSTEHAQSQDSAPPLTVDQPQLAESAKQPHQLPGTPTKLRRSSRAPAPNKRSHAQSVSRTNKHKLAFATLACLATSHDNLQEDVCDAGCDSTSAFTHYHEQLSYATIGVPINGWPKAKQDPKHSQAFYDAYCKEMGTLYKLGAIYKVLDKDVPRNKRRFRSTCVFLLKPDGKGGISKVKARTCLDGSRMVQGTHYTTKRHTCPSGSASEQW